MKAKVFDSALFGRLLQFAKPYRKRFIGSILFAIGLAVFSALRPYMLKQTVDSYIEPRDSQGLLLYICLMALVLLLEVFSQFYFTYWANWLGQDIVKDIRIKLFAHLMNFKMRYFDTTPVGTLVTRTVSDLEAIARIFSQGLFMILSDLLKMLTVLIAMYVINWELSTIVIIFIPILVWVTRVFQKKMQVAFEEVRGVITQLNTFVQERLSGMKIVQIFNREAQEAKAFSQINDRHRKAWIKTILYNSIFFPIADIITNVALGVVVWYGALNILGGNDTTSVSDLIAYTMSISLLFNPLRQIADKFNEMQMGMIAANRVFQLLDSQANVQVDGTEICPEIKGHIEFKNVQFSYTGNPENTVLHDFSLEIQPGETLAIVGATGAGKSTIINLLNRLYDIQSGEITIDGQSIAKMQLASLRPQIGIVLQDVFLFADTIYNNITLYDERIDEQTVYESAKQIGLHDFILSLPGGYQYNVRERGVMLSAGQRQLIAFLRTYVSNPSILILDEASSSIDSYTEDLMQIATQKLTKDRTSIVIAHRLATVMQADRILVMDKGRIVEMGSHQQLLANPEGYYYNLYQSQFWNQA